MTETAIEPPHSDDRARDAQHTELFTGAQRRVLKLLCQGLKNSEIADRIGVKETTIKATVSSILRKLQVYSRTQAVVRVCQEGMVEAGWCAGTDFGPLDLKSVRSAIDVPASAIRRVHALTKREMKVLDMVSQGLPNKEIAFRLGVREGTVKAHMGSILRKLGVSSRTKLAIEVSKLQTAASRSRSNAESDKSKPL